MYNDGAVLLGMVYNFPAVHGVSDLHLALPRWISNLLEAAQDLGADHLRTFWRITAPL